MVSIGTSHTNLPCGRPAQTLPQAVKASWETSFYVSTSAIPFLHATHGPPVGWMPRGNQHITPSHADMSLFFLPYISICLSLNLTWAAFPANILNSSFALILIDWVMKVPEGFLATLWSFLSFLPFFLLLFILGLVKGMKWNQQKPCFSFLWIYYGCGCDRWERQWTHLVGPTYLQGQPAIRSELQIADCFNITVILRSRFASGNCKFEIALPHWD